MVHVGPLVHLAWNDPDAVEVQMSKDQRCRQNHKVECPAKTA